MSATADEMPPDDDQAEPATLLPQAAASELAILGASMQSRSAAQEAAEHVTGQDFYSTKRRQIWEAIRAVVDLGPDTVPDLVAVMDQLESSGKLQSIGGPDALLKIANAGHCAAMLSVHGRRVRETASQRGLMLVGHALANGVRNGTDSAAIAATSTAAIATAMRTAAGPTSGTVMAKAVVTATFEHMERCMDSGVVDKGLSTGFRALDEMTGGMRPDEMIILGARPGVGKSAFGMNVMVHLLRRGVPIHFESLEMSKRQVGNRLLSQFSGVPSARIRDCEMREDQWGDLTDAVNFFTSSPLSMSFQRARKLSEIQAAARQQREERGIELLVVDYLTIIRPDERLDDRRLEVDTLSGGLKDLACELGIPVLVLAQLSRKSSDRGGKAGDEPRISDLKESGQIESDADQIWLLHRAITRAAPKKGEDDDRRNDPRKAILIVGKNRDGDSGEIPLAYRGEIVKFESDESEDDQPSGASSSWHDKDGA